MRTPDKDHRLQSRRRRRQQLMMLIVSGAVWTSTVSTAAEISHSAIVIKPSRAPLLDTPATTEVAVSPSNQDGVRPHSSTRKPSNIAMVAATQPATAIRGKSQQLATAKINPFVIRPMIQQAVSTEASSITNSGSPDQISANTGSSRSGGSPSRLPTLAKPRLMSPIAPTKIHLAEPVQGAVQTNPMVASGESNRRGGAENQTADPIEEIESVGLTEMGLAMATEASDGPHRELEASQSQVKDSLSAENSMTSEFPTSEFSIPDREMMKTDEEVSFSLSDDDDWDFGGQNEVALTDPDEPSSSSGVAEPSDSTSSDASSPTDEGYTFHLDHQSLATDPIADSDTMDSNGKMDVGPVINSPVQPMAISIEEASPIEQSTAPQTANIDFESLLRRYHYRPPVEVDAIGLPTTATGQSSESTIEMANDYVSNQVEMADDVGPSSTNELSVGDTSDQTPRLRLPSGVKMIPLQLNLAAVRSLTLGGHLQQLHVMDDSVCQAVATSPTEVKLIGTGNGVTQLVVCAETTDSQGGAKRCIRAFEIRVDDHNEAASADDSLVTLDESIRRTFPTAEITLSHRGDELEVAGRCDTENQAKKILRMVRRTCLMPVDDQLQVR